MTDFKAVDAKVEDSATGDTNCCDTCVCEECPCDRDSCVCESDAKCCDSCACGTDCAAGEEGKEKTCACGIPCECGEGKDCCCTSSTAPLKEEIKGMAQALDECEDEIASLQKEVDALKVERDALKGERDAAVQKVSTTTKYWKDEEGKWTTERNILQEKLNKCVQVCQLLTEGVKKGQSGGAYTLEEAFTLYSHIKQLNEVLMPPTQGGGGAK